MDKKYLIIDFDSTFIKVEALEVLSEIVLKNHPDRETIIEKIKKITKRGMEGKIPFQQSLLSRLKFLKIRKSHLRLLIKKLKKEISGSIIRNKKFFKEHKEQIYILSNAFREFIIPIVKAFGVVEDRVFANTFVYDGKGNVIGIDGNNPLSRTDGKAKIIELLKLVGNVYVIGDGYSDYLIRKRGLAKKFFVFCENVRRKNIVKEADHVVANFDEVLNIFRISK